MNQQSYGFTSGQKQDGSAAYDRLDASGASFDVRQQNAIRNEPLPALPWPSKLYDDVANQ